VVDDERRPQTILPGTQLLRLGVPAYCQEEPALARAVDEPAADVFLRGIGDRTVAEALPPRERRELAVVPPDATVLEIAALMARAHSPLVVVANPGGPVRGAITLDALLERILPR
jgi:hypothetical protein